MPSEATTDIFIANLLTEANIEYETQKSEKAPIKKALKGASKNGEGGLGHPEFIAQVKDFLIIIEDKADTDKQVKYCNKNTMRLDLRPSAVINYAENGALHYGIHIANNSSFKKIFVFGCSGTEKHHHIRPIFVTPRRYILLEEVENFENFNEENIEKYYHEQVLRETPEEEIELQTLMKKSSELNSMLRNYGQLGDSEKPLVVSAILLALNENLSIDYLTGDNIRTDGDKIHEFMCCNLDRIDVGDKRNAILHQFTLIKDRTKLNTIHAKLGETPLKYFTEFIKEEIFPSISSTRADILGYFYGEFIKYSGGDGQSLGIVLTPKHITELFCELAEVKPTDKILDPCCGTCGFLIAAMHHMFKQVSTEDEKTYIKQNNLHGIEIREDMFSIATTNMILRGDGKSNLILADFFDIPSEKLHEEKYTVGLMNPPYSQRADEVTAELSEIHFVKHLLDSLADGGRCVVIVPQSTMIGKNTDDKEIKKAILKDHTLEGVITLNPDTFYRVGTMPCAAVFTAHQPHPENKRCKFVNFEDDGYVVKKNTGLVETARAIERRKYLFKYWNDEEDNPPSKFMVKSKIKHDDEWLHAFYYFNDDIPTEESFKETMSEFINFEFEMILKDRDYLFKE